MSQGEDVSRGYQDDRGVRHAPEVHQPSLPPRVSLQQGRRVSHRRATSELLWEDDVAGQDHPSTHQGRTQGEDPCLPAWTDIT